MIYAYRNLADGRRERRDGTLVFMFFFRCLNLKCFDFMHCDSELEKNILILDGIMMKSEVEYI